MQISSTGLLIECTAPPQFLLSFLDSVLRGIGQVMLQSNSYTGLLFLIGIYYNSMLFSWAVLLGTTASTATAVLLEVDRAYGRADCWGSIDGPYHCMRG